MQEQLAAAISTEARPVDVTVTPYAEIEGDAVIRRVIAPRGAHRSAHEQQSVWVVRGHTMVVVNVQGFKPGLRMDRALQEVFRRLGEPSPEETPPSPPSEP